VGALRTNLLFAPKYLSDFKSQMTYLCFTIHWHRGPGTHETHSQRGSILYTCSQYVVKHRVHLPTDIRLGLVSRLQPWLRGMRLGLYVVLKPEHRPIPGLCVVASPRGLIPAYRPLGATLSIRLGDPERLPAGGEGGHF